QKTWERLQALDPQAAAKIDPNDAYRLVRALEICEATGSTVTALNEEHERTRAKFPWPLKKVGCRPSRENERRRVEKRADAMIAGGLIEETRALLDRGLADWPPLQSVGYKETAEYLRGNIASLEDLREKIVNSTMYLAKRQRTWFQRDPEITWIDPDDNGALA